METTVAWRTLAVDWSPALSRLNACVGQGAFGSISIYVQYRQSNPFSCHDPAFPVFSDVSSHGVCYPSGYVRNVYDTVAQPVQRILFVKLLIYLLYFLLISISWATLYNLFLLSVKSAFMGHLMWNHFTVDKFVCI